VTGATAEGTGRFAARVMRRDIVEEHFRDVEDLKVSTVGLGTYLGDCDDATDESYRQAINEAVSSGCNFLDTASNYRCQRSERTLGRALIDLESDGITRDELVIATKGGYIPFDGTPPADPADYVRERFLDRSVFTVEDVAAGSHVLAPSFLKDQLEQSLGNLGIAAVDIYYLHNPETQLASVGPGVFEARMRSAIEFLERAVSEGKIRFYGTATWNAYRVTPESKDFVSLAEVVAIEELQYNFSELFWI